MIKSFEGACTLGVNLLLRGGARKRFSFPFWLTSISLPTYVHDRIHLHYPSVLSFSPHLYLHRKCPLPRPSA